MAQLEQWARDQKIEDTGSKVIDTLLPIIQVDWQGVSVSVSLQLYLDICLQLLISIFFWICNLVLWSRFVTLSVCLWICSFVLIPETCLLQATQLLQARKSEEDVNGKFCTSRLCSCSSVSQCLTIRTILFLPFFKVCK